MFPTHTETERVELKRVSRESVDVDEFYYRFNTDGSHAKAVFDHIPDEPFETEKDVVEFLNRAARQWDDGETAVYAVSPKQSQDGSGALAGYAHLWLDWEHRKAELGLLLDKPFWGREYATEVYLQLTEIAFSLHGIDLVEIGHPVPNTNSRRSIEKFVDEAGGQFDGVVHNNEWCGDDLCDARRYSVSQADFVSTDQ